MAFNSLTGCFDIETYWSLQKRGCLGQSATGGWSTKENKSFSHKMSPWVRRPTLDANWSACSSIDFRLGWAVVQTKPLVLSCLASDWIINIKKCVCVSFIAVQNTHEDGDSKPKLSLTDYIKLKGDWYSSFTILSVVGAKTQTFFHVFFIVKTIFMWTYLII